MSPPHLGQGQVGAAAGDGHLDVHAVANPASCRVAEKAGFRLEGVLAQSHRYGDGVYHDEHLHARLAVEA